MTQSKPRNPQASPKLLLSLFAGCGGLDAGFRRGGFQTGLAIDNDPTAVASYNFNHGPKARVLDLATVDVREIMDAWSEVSIAGPQGIIGGPPCQAFSTSNVSDTYRDPRKSLVHSYSTIVAKFARHSPIEFCVFENVTGLLAERHRHHYRKLKRTLSSVGLEVFEVVLNARDFGVPQSRSRLFVIGLPKGAFADFEPLLARSLAPDRRKSVRDTIADLPEPFLYSRDADPETFPAHPNHWTMVPKSARFDDDTAKRRPGRSFRVLDWDRPSWTVAYGHREVHVHPKGHRRLSVYEAMLLQGFSPKYRLLGNLSDQYRQVSDSVPPPLAAAIARRIKKILRERSQSPLPRK